MSTVEIPLEQLPQALQDMIELLVPTLGLELAKAAMLHLHRNIVRASPVGDPREDKHPGLYRDSHTVSKGAPVFKEMPILPSYPIPGDDDAEAGMAGAEPGETLFVATEAKPEGAKRGYSDILEAGRRQYSRREVYFKNGKQLSRGRSTMWIGSEQAEDGVYEPSVAVTLEEHATIEAEAIKATEQRLG